MPKVIRPPARTETAPRTGVAMAVIMTGVLMTAVDTTIVVLALPEIQRGLHVALSAVVWVIISFLLLVPGYVLGSVAGPYAGRLADRHGPVLPATAGLAIQVAGLAVYTQLGLTIFVGSTSLHGALAAAFTSGLHAAFYASMGFMVLAAVLSALRARSASAGR